MMILPVRRCFLSAVDPPPVDLLSPSCQGTGPPHQRQSGWIGKTLHSGGAGFQGHRPRIVLGKTCGKSPAAPRRSKPPARAGSSPPLRRDARRPRRGGLLAARRLPAPQGRDLTAAIFAIPYGRGGRSRWAQVNLGSTAARDPVGAQPCREELGSCRLRGRPCSNSASRCRAPYRRSAWSSTRSRRSCLSTALLFWYTLWM